MLKYIIVAFAVSSAILPPSSHAQGSSTYLTYKNTYASGTNYVKGAVVKEGTGSYVSLIPDNMGHDPATDISHMYWDVLTAGAVINAGSSLSAAVTACGSAQTTIQITQTIAVGSGITVPRNCPLLFESAGNLTGTSITINSAITAAPLQIFGAGLAVTLGPATTGVPIEMFGGKADGTGVSGVGTDNCTPYTAAYNALSGGDIRLGTLGMYRTSCAFAISKPSINLRGVTRGVSVSGSSTTPISTILIDSATLPGVSTSGSALWNDFSDLQCLRVATTPGSTSKCFDIEAGGGSGHDLVAQDSVWPFYFKGAGALGQGSWTELYAGWGFTGFAGAPAVASCGFMMDTTGPQEENDLKLYGPKYGPTSLAFMTAGVTGICLSGPNVSDVWVFDSDGARVTHAIDIEATGTTNGSMQNIHIINATVESDGDAVIVNGLATTLDIAPHLIIQGGFINVGSGNGITVSNSSGVSILGVQFLQGSLGSAAHTDLALNTVNGFQVNNNDFSGASLINISCSNSSNGTIVGNKIKTANTSTGATGIKNVACTNVSEQGNTIAGNGGFNLLNGITFDAASSNNGPWSLNNIDSATVTTPVTDGGTNNNLLSPTAIRLAGGTPITSQSAAQSQLVTCTTGGTGTQYCGADGAWHSATPHEIPIGGVASSTGVVGPLYVTVPFACTITGWSLQIDAGTATVKWLKVAAGTAIPTIGSNSINTSGVSISTGTVKQSTTLTDFTTTTVSTNDIIALDLTAVSGATYIAGQLFCQ